MNNHDCPIVPVLDLMIGQIVLAKAGDRESYRPVHSRLTASSDPVEVAMAMHSQTGCRQFYLADIDTFEGALPNWTVYQRLAERGLQLWVDADWTGDRARRLIELSETLASPGAIVPIVSSEPLRDLTELELLSQFKSSDLSPIFSLDLKAGEVMTRVDPPVVDDSDAAQTDSIQVPCCVGQSSAAQVTAPQWIASAIEQGARHAIVLDVANVGTEAGPSHQQMLSQLRTQFPDLLLSSGGGIRMASDAQALLNSGCNHVLVASAIHNCAFTPDDVAGLTGRGVG